MIKHTRLSRDGIRMEERQLWNNPRPAATTSPTCDPLVLPSGGVLSPGLPDAMTLVEDMVFQPLCSGSGGGIVYTGSGSPNSATDFRDPFYASTLPECYALAAATVIAYMLVIMLLITPRTFLHEGAVVLGRRGFTNGPSGGNNGIGIGGRPWLQKVAAASVAISLTIATAETLAVAESQYNQGFMDAARLQTLVEDGKALKSFRVISDTFLWLAQAQTLIRLFPRQREKIIIKWTAFALITLDVLFSILNNFLFEGSSRPRTFVDAIPALSYLFQLALSLLYCAWVVYYALSKKRFAFYHQQMRNQCLVALLSLISVLVPVVFFVVDISKPEVAGWGDYVRWVGAAAASVVVWEWVERIEALERNEKKDGVLGREVFDGDEMLEVTPSSDSHWGSRFRSRKDDEKGGDDDATGGVTSGSNGLSWPGVAGIANRYRPRLSQDIETGLSADATDRRGRKKAMRKKGPRPRPPLWPTRPAPAATPVSRTETASAESTVYAVRYHPLSESTPPGRDNDQHSPQAQRENPVDITAPRSPRLDDNEESEKPVVIERHEDAHIPERKTTTWEGFARVNPFRRKVQGPPIEVSAHTVKLGDATSVHGSSYRWDVRAKIEDFAVTQADKIREKARASDNSPNLPVTVIPAPARRRHYEAALEELEETESRNNNGFPPQGLQIDPEPPIQPRTQRSSDPYRPDDLNGQSLHQRGALSFITTVPHERVLAPEHDPRPPSPSIPQPPWSEDERDAVSSPVISRSSPVQLRSSTSSASPSTLRRDGLPVLTIPAPARRPRSASDSE